MNPGSVLDFYDDPTGMVLKAKLPKDQIPDYIKQAEFKTPEKLASLHDDAFAVVLVDQGKKMRKFACVDKGNTALSVIYFLENRNKLTKEAQEVAARNLVDACADFGLEAPLLLKAAAGVAAKRKSADLTGSEVMPLQASRPKYDSGEEDIPVSSEIKKASSRYVDITGKRVMAKTAAVSCEHYCLEKEGSRRFPIDSYGDVLLADRWFGENKTSLSPEDRREYCTKLAARASDLGIDLSDETKKYASTAYANRDDVEAAIATRMRFWVDGDAEHDLLNGLMGKYASVSPDAFCAALSQFDSLTGLNLMWDNEIPDPIASTYGIEKKAEWSWAQDSDVLKEDQLKQGVRDSVKIHQIRARFGDEIADALSKNPTGIFDSLPVDSKRIICRVVQDTQ